MICARLSSVIGTGDGLAVQRGIGLALQLLQQSLLLLIFLLALLQALEQVGGGVNVNAGIIAIDDRHLAVPVVLNILALDQGGDVHAAGPVSYTHLYSRKTVLKAVYGLSP